MDVSIVMGEFDVGEPTIAGWHSVLMALPKAQFEHVQQVVLEVWHARSGALSVPQGETPEHAEQRERVLSTIIEHMTALALDVPTVGAAFMAACLRDGTGKPAGVLAKDVYEQATASDMLAVIAAVRDKGLIERLLERLGNAMGLVRSPA